MKLSILVIGTQNPRIRDFFSQVARYANVTYLDVEPIGRIPQLRRLLKSWRWSQNAGEIPQATLLVPRRWNQVSAFLSNWFCRRRFSRTGTPDVVVFTWPHHAYLAEKLSDLTRVYYCKDPFEYWTWGADYIRPYETRLLENVDAVFAVSRLIVSDFQPRTSAKLFYLPNGVCDWFLGDTSPRPADLPTDQPLIGSVGEINRDYDWDYVQAIVKALPQVRFCFLGRLHDPAPQANREISNIFRSNPNMLLLGWRDYQLMPAYMRSFDILMNFLRADAFGDRRSPLRLYDYLTTDRPIISTPVREAHEHLPHIHIAKDPGEAILLIREILAGRRSPDIPARRNYIASHSWHARAKEFLAEVEKLVGAKRERSQP
ncbi:MAG: hypothetical protein ABSF29_12065 [Tepidisphaeraceae bacterium]|jgi:hypothetical protein